MPEELGPSVIPQNEPAARPRILDMNHMALMSWLPFHASPWAVRKVNKIETPKQKALIRMDQRLHTEEPPFKGNLMNSIALSVLAGRASCLFFYQCVDLRRFPQPQSYPVCRRLLLNCSVILARTAETVC